MNSAIIHLDNAVSLIESSEKSNARLSELFVLFNAEFVKCEAERDRLAARVRALEGALRPFAEVTILSHETDEMHIEIYSPVKEILAARVALDTTEAGDD